MRMTGEVAGSVDAYIKACPPEVQKVLRKLRSVIRKAAPGSEEKISYGMPAFFQDGALVYFASCRNHIGFYPTGSGVAAFERELSGYVHSKGAIQFPLDKPVPYGLVTKIVKFRVAEVKAKNREKTDATRAKEKTTKKRSAKKD